jgi:hypothetical protein
MADVRIIDLSSATAVGTSVVPATNAAGSATNKVTLQSIADLAVGSDTTQAGGGTAVDNIVSITQSAYDALSSKDANTIYFIQ